MVIKATQQSDMHLNYTSPNVSNVGNTDTELPTASENKNAGNAEPKIIAQLHAQAPDDTAQTARETTKPGTTNALQESQKATDWQS